MSLAPAVLTSALEKSSSGYELARRLDKSIGHFWHATHQQIHRELAGMEVASWIESSSAPDAGETRKREYRVLSTGCSELIRWVYEPSTPMDFRDEFMVKLRADAALSEVDLRPKIRRQIEQHQEKLAHYRAIEERDFLLKETRFNQIGVDRNIAVGTVFILAVFGVDVVITVCIHMKLNCFELGNLFQTNSGEVGKGRNPSSGFSSTAFRPAAGSVNRRTKNLREFGVVKGETLGSGLATLGALDLDLFKRVVRQVTGVLAAVAPGTDEGADKTDFVGHRGRIQSLH